ncbi:MAG: FadR/GntR family transcriptional regulator [Actinoplanes sp.]
MALTDTTIAELRRMIRSGELPPGARLPPEKQLAAQFGISRGGVREAVKVLEAAHVLVVRRGDGTYVTGLEPRALLSCVGPAVELLRGDALPQVAEVRKLLEPAATGLAARRITDRQLASVAGALRDMRAASGDPDLLLRADVAFHRAAVAGTGNDTLIALLDGLSGGAVRARRWRGMALHGLVGAAIDEHRVIYDALRAHDPLLAQSAVLLHLTTPEPGG